MLESRNFFCNMLNRQTLKLVKNIWWNMAWCLLIKMVDSVMHACLLFYPALYIINVSNAIVVTLISTWSGMRLRYCTEVPYKP
jgi:hypothetical protein